MIYTIKMDKEQLKEQLAETKAKVQEKIAHLKKNSAR